MAMLVQCPNPACKASCSVAEANSGGPVRCPKCDKPFVVKPTVDAQKGDTNKHPPASNANPFPVLPAEFGRYRILKLLGRGGMGAVYLAQDSHLGRQVALKVPFFDASKSPQRAERFVREARSAAVLQHPNICTVFDAGQIDGRPFITMAYIAGTPLEEEIDPEAPMPQLRAAEIVRKVALALEHAHRKGIVHRDLKPANVMIEAGGEPVVMDFGLAKRVADADPNEAKLTHFGTILGTVSYMSPEQVKGDVQAIGPATDVYSLGVILFEMLTGKTPYTGAFSVVAGQILTAPVPPVQEFRPDVHSRLDAVCRKAMAKEPADRYASMAEYADALGSYLKAPVASPPPLPVPPAAAVAQAPSPAVGRSPFDDLEDATPSTPASKKAKRGRVVADLPPSAQAATVSKAAPSITRAALESLYQQTAPLFRKKWPILAVVASCLLLGLAGLWSAGVFKLKTQAGTIVVENLPADAEVFVDGEKVALKLKGDDKPIEIQVAPGKRKLEIKAGGFKMETQEVTLAAGERKPIDIRLEPVTEVVSAPPPATAPADALRRADIPEAVLASLGGGDPKRAPPELVAVLGDGRFRFAATSYYPAFSPDGALLAVPSGGEVFLFDANTGQLLRRFRGRGERVGSVTFSPNGAILAIGDGQSLMLWDPRTGVLLTDLSGQARGWDAGVVFTPDSQTVLSCSLDKSVRAWEVATGRQTHVLSAEAEMSTLAVTPDGRLVVAGTRDGRVHGWSCDTGAEKFVVEAGKEPWIWCNSVSADGQWLASGTNGRLKVWKIADLANKNPAPFFEKQTPAAWVQFEKHSNKLWTAEFTDHATKKGACCWDPASGQLVTSVTLQGTETPWMAYALSPDDRTLAALSCVGHVVQLYDTRTGKPRFPDPGPTRAVWRVAFSPDGRWLAAGGEDNTVRLWDMATGTQRLKLEGHGAAVDSVSFSPDGKLLASGSYDGTIALWDSASGARVGTLNGHQRDTTVRFSPDGKLVAAGTGDGGVRMWYAHNGEEARTLPGLHEGIVRCVAFSPDGQRLATGGDDGKLVIIDLANGKVLQSFKRNSGVFTLDFGADGETVAAGYRPPEPVVRIWNLKDKDFIVLQGHTDDVHTVSLRSDGRLALTSSFDGSVRLWEVGGNLPRKMVLGLGAVGERLWWAALSPDGRYAATANSNGTIYLFRLPDPAEDVGAWLAARGNPPRGLSEEAWLERVKGLYVGNVPDAVSDRLRELNPGYDRQPLLVIEGGVVTDLGNVENARDISPLRALPGLRALSVGQGPLADLSPLKDMKLTWLHCVQTRVSDLSPLKDMKLTYLDVSGTGVSDLKPLKDMKLTYLDVIGTPVSDLSPLKDMKLTDLQFAGTKASDLTPLKGMPLTFLNCANTPLSNLTPLKDAKLTCLDCRNTQVSDLAPLRGMPLTELYISFTGVSDLSPLADMKLTKLYCDHTQLTGAGLAPLQEMSSLRWLEIGGPKMTDAGLEHLEKLTDLEVLCLYTNNRYASGKLTGAGLVHLKGMTRLQVLRLDNTELTDEGLVHLKGLLSLRDLNLEHTRVTDAGLEHLVGLKNLGQLNLGGTAVTEQGVAKLKAALPHCNISR